MSGSTIGIKIADGSFYPVLEEGFTGKKKLTLTTVKDNQDKVQIDLYRGEGETLEDAAYIGSLLIENIAAAPKGQPDIELLLGLDENGELTAEASDRSTGESQSFSISLKTLSADETYEVPEFEMEGDATKIQSTEVKEEAPITGETYPVAETDRRKDHLERKGPSTALIVLFVVLGIALLGAIGWFVYRNVAGRTPAVTETQTPEPTQPAEPAPTEPAPASPAPETSQTAPTEPQATTEPAPASTDTVAQTQSEAGGVSTAAKPATEPQPKGGVTYRIKRGDTLWDISATYYRNPWLYPKLAKANNIKNPDLIFADATIFIPEE